MHAPFNSTKERDCLRKGPKGGVPGPGQYIDISNPHHSSVCKSLLKFSADRGFAEAHGVKIGPFGSNTQRFSGGYFAAREGPGPGQYNPGDVKN